jgi:hypothetical protein
MTGSEIGLAAQMYSEHMAWERTWFIVFAIESLKLFSSKSPHFESSYSRFYANLKKSRQTQKLGKKASQVTALEGMSVLWRTRGKVLTFCERSTEARISMGISHLSTASAPDI